MGFENYATYWTDSYIRSIIVIRYVKWWLLSRRARKRIAFFIPNYNFLNIFLKSNFNFGKWKFKKSKLIEWFTFFDVEITFFFSINSACLLRLEFYPLISVLPKYAWVNVVITLIHSLPFFKTYILIGVECCVSCWQILHREGLLLRKMIACRHTAM